jgi:hypothetical protein
LIKECILAGVQPALLRKLIFFAVIIGAAMALSYLIDDNLEWGWPTNVIRNWQEFGFFNLHGMLVTNPGGFQAKTHPEVYKGMSPVFLYPVYFAAEIFSWTGLDTQAFHILLLAVVLWSLWRLLGRDNFAVIAAAVTVLCPGYLRWPKDFDPGALSVLPALPYAVLVLAILKKPKFTPALAAALFVLTLGFVSLNWTAAWVCGASIFFFMARPGINRRGLIFLFVVMAIGILTVAAMSFAVKAGSDMSGAGPKIGPGRIIAGYTWGNMGYGEGLTTGRAFLRLAFVNGIGLFPLWLVFLYAMACRIRSGAGLSWLMFAPLALTVSDVVIMRNYFGHHPWMAGPVLLVGVVFSLVLLRTLPPGHAPEISGKIPFKIVLVLALLCFVYGFAVLTFLRANEEELLSLMHLVREDTARPDTLIIPKTDSVTVPMVARLNESLDRHIIIVDDVKGMAVTNNHCVILSAVELDNSLSLRAQSTAHSKLGLGPVTGWFDHSVAKRVPGDRLELADTYYLYEPGPVSGH